MRATIDLPEPVFEARDRAAQQDSSVETVILNVIENAIAPAPRSADGPTRVRLPIVPSKRPGTLRSMTGGEIDDILG